MSLPKIADLVQAHNDTNLAPTFYLAGLRTEASRDSGSSGPYTSSYAIIVADWVGVVYAINGWHGGVDDRQAGSPLAPALTQSPMSNDDQLVALDILNSRWDDTELGRMFRFQPTFEGTAAKTLVDDAFDYETLNYLEQLMKRGEVELVAAHPLNQAQFADQLKKEAQLVADTRSRFPSMGKHNLHWMREPVPLDQERLEGRLSTCGAWPQGW